jgi:hypothetical protein
MFAWFAFHKTNLAASKFGPWISKAFNRKAKIRNLAALTSALLTAMLIVVFAVNTSDWFIKPDLTRRQVLSMAQDRPRGSSLEAILITLRPHGFEPAQVSHTEGVFLLAVHNRSGQNRMMLRLDKVGGNRLIERSVSREKLDLREAVDLPPGLYALTEANHPHWVCYLDITHDDDR